jgi:hypothetical protein
MSNTNCLQGMCCPACGQADRFDIQAQSLFTMVDDGADHHADVEYDDGSYCECPACGHSGIVHDFREADVA